MSRCGDRAQRRGASTRGQRWRRRYGLAAIGAAIIVRGSRALARAWIAPYRPTRRRDAAAAAAVAAHWLGTDTLGRDVLSRLIYGARCRCSSASWSCCWARVRHPRRRHRRVCGGWAEHALMRFTDLVLCFPPIILAMAIAAALGIGTVNTMIAMLVVWWPKFARLARGLVLVQRHQEYVEAAHVIGYGPGRVLLKHILPNALGPLIVLCTLDVGHAILVFAGLSFLGLGVVPPTAEWGAMVSEGRELVEQWWCATFAGLAIFTVVMGFNFLGDGVRDWLDPRARRR
jgi:peptide/nickel transport system permease protein